MVLDHRCGNHRWPHWVEGRRSWIRSDVLTKGCALKRRDLTVGERAILELIQVGYGPQNTEDQVFFSDTGDATIFVRARDGSSPLCAVLTNLATWRADGTIKSDQELEHQWLLLE
jgi:hypothetical protein